MKRKFYYLVVLLIGFHVFCLNAARYSEIGKRAAALTNVYFCVKISNGEQISSGVDDILWQGMGCDDVIEKAFSVGCTESEINEQIKKAQGISKRVEKESSIDWEEVEIDFEIAAERAAIVTDLHFCAKMANGEKISNGDDSFIWGGMGCDDIIEKAFAVGMTKKEILKIIKKARQIKVLKNEHAAPPSDLEGFRRDLKASLKRSREEFEKIYSKEIEELYEDAKKIKQIYNIE